MGQALTRKINKKKRKNLLKVEAKEEYFIHNGGVLLEKRISLSQGLDNGASQVKFFSAIDIQNATNYYKPNIILGGGVEFTVYKGILEERFVAIIVAREPMPDCKPMDFWLTEAATMMVMNHANLVKFYGCCLETRIPILVYEFCPNQSLYEHLHGAVAVIAGTLKWDERLTIATEMAYMLSYMHTALAKPVVHRDVQSHNILLGDSYCGKLAGFGHSVSITPGKTSQKWPVVGTPGYVDPEYIETHEVTDKCDVYSFGVLLLELLTRRHPCMLLKDGNQMDLVDLCTSAVGSNQVMEIMDKNVLDQANNDDIERVARLALTCVAKKGVDRPTTMEIVNDLRQARGQHKI